MSQLSALPLYHSAGLVTAAAGYEAGNDLHFLPRFTSSGFVAVVEEKRIRFTILTPSHLAILRRDGAFPALGRSGVYVLHTGAPCPLDLKQDLIAALGPDRVHEMYSSTEQGGMTLCSGSEWRKHPGTVGRGLFTRILIARPDGTQAAVGEIGAVHLVRFADELSSRSRSREQPAATTLGDRGFVDEEGYLFLTGRETSVVKVGGEFVHPDAVREVLLGVPGVIDAAVRPVPDPILGSVLAAVVALTPAATRSELAQACRANLPPSSWIRRWVLIDEWPRDERGKTPLSVIDALLAGNAGTGP